jgi:hypothetical protein
MRTGLFGRGLPHEVSVLIDGERVVIASRSGAVRDAEVGTPCSPPKAPMEGIARDATQALLHTIVAKLQDTWV